MSRFRKQELKKLIEYCEQNADVPLEFNLLTTNGGLNTAQRFEPITPYTIDIGVDLENIFDGRKDRVLRAFNLLVKHLARTSPEYIEGERYNENGIIHDHFTITAVEPKAEAA